MSKAEGKLIGIKFNLPINPITLTNEETYSDYFSPLGIYSASSSFASYTVNGAFDKSTSSFWMTISNLPQWVMVELPNAVSIGGFKMYSGGNYRPNAVDLYGSNDGINFDLITQTTNANTTGWKEYTFNATIPYKYYKWTATSKHSDYCAIYELQIKTVEVIYISGNENAFTVSAQEYLYTNGADNNGELVNKEYVVKTVKTHPTEPNSIQLVMSDEIRNSQGLITISYNQALGNLAGAGGAVASFTETFIPTDLEEGLTGTGGEYGTHEYINASVGGSIELVYITKYQGYAPAEYIQAGVGGSIELKHISDINP